MPAFPGALSPGGLLERVPRLSEPGAALLPRTVTATGVPCQETAPVYFIAVTADPAVSLGCRTGPGGGG